MLGHVPAEIILGYYQRKIPLVVERRALPSRQDRIYLDLDEVFPPTERKLPVFGSHFFTHQGHKTPFSVLHSFARAR